jgi:hypothetical protein
VFVYRRRTDKQEGEVMKFCKWIGDHLACILCCVVFLLVGFIVGLFFIPSDVYCFLNLIANIIGHTAVGHILLAGTAIFAFLAFLLSLYGPPVRLNVSIREKKDRYENIRGVINVMVANESSKPVRPLQIILEIKNSENKILIGPKKDKRGDSRLRFKSDSFEDYSLTDTWLKKFRILEPYDRKTYSVPYEKIKEHLETKVKHMAEGDKTKIMEEGCRLYAGVEVPISRPAWFCFLKCYPDRYVESTQDLDGQEAYLEMTEDLKGIISKALRRQPVNRHQPE